MKDKKKFNSLIIKEMIIKCLIVFTGISEIIGFGIGCWSLISEEQGNSGVILSMVMIIVIPCILISIIFIIGSTVKEGKPNPKNYKIKYYDCTLELGIKNRMEIVYGEVKSSEHNPKNFYSTYHKKYEAVIIAVMHVTEEFNENEYIDFMNEIPEVSEHIQNHTLIVIFIEEEKSSYLQEIMYTPEYNSLWDTKVFCVYDENKKRLKVNKTNSGTGNKAYNDAKKDLDKIFGFIKQS